MLRVTKSIKMKASFTAAVQAFVNTRNKFRKMRRRQGKIANLLSSLLYIDRVISALSLANVKAKITQWL